MILNFSTKYPFLKYYFIYLIIASITSCQERYADDESVLFEENYQIAKTFWKNRDNQNSILTIDSLIIHSQNAKNYKYLGKSYYLKSFVLRSMKSRDGILQSMLKSRSAYLKANDYKQYSDVCAAIGVYLIDHQKTYGAGFFVKESLTSAEKTGSKKHLANAYFNYGWWLRKQDQFDSALYYYQLAKPLEEELGRSFKLANIYLEEGHIFSELHEYDMAATKFKEVLPIADELKHFELMARCYNNLGFCTLQEGDLDAAVNNFNLALKYTQSSDKFIAATYNNLGKTYLKNNQVAKSVSAFKQSLAYQDKNGFEVSEEMTISFRELQRYYARIGNMDSMLHYSELQNTMTQTVLLHKRELDSKVIRENIDEILASDNSDED